MEPLWKPPPHRWRRKTHRYSYARSPQGGALSVEQLREFDGHKPEGLSLSSNPGYFTVAFDAGDATPHWIQVPWPK